jgi:hypothetical protein
MLYFADNLLDSNTVLQALSLEAVFHRVRDDAALREDIARLRRVRQIDKSAYARLKARLPYFCGARFEGGIRRSAHFEQIGWMILDVDHYDGPEADLEALRVRLCADERVALLFRSPGGDGLKLVFRLQEPCTDTKQFSDAYKGFAFAFGEQYGLERYIDFRTCDATRVCFLSSDPGAYVNPMAETVAWQRYLPEQVQPVLVQALFSASATEGVVAPEKPGCSHQIHPETYADILRKLQTRARPNPLKRDVFVPEALQAAVPAVVQALSAEGIEVTEQRDIQFGCQLIARHGNNTAAVNVFYGKKGFSVVLVPRKSDHPQLGDLLVFVAEQAIYGRHAWPGQPAGDVAGLPESADRGSDDFLNYIPYA